MSELERVIEDFRVPPGSSRPPFYWTRQQNKLVNDRSGSIDIPYMGELYRDMYSAATKYKPSVTPKTSLMKNKILHAIHGNLYNIFNQAMKECDVAQFCYRKSSNPYNPQANMDDGNYSCLLQADPGQFYWGINHGTFTDERDAALLRARSTALLQAITSENAQNHIREGLDLPTDFTMADLLERVYSPSFEFLETYSVGISLCNPVYAHIIIVNAGLMRNTGYNQFALFHPPEAVSKHALFQGARVVWCRLHQETRKKYLESFLGSLKVEIIEPLFPLLHFMFNWKHGLAQSMIFNKDSLLEVHTGSVLDVIAKDHQGLLFENYGHLQLDCGLHPPAKRVEFARREVFIAHLIQHGWLMLRKAILDTFMFDFVCTVHDQHTQKMFITLSNSARKKKKKRAKRKTPQKKEKPNEESFLQAILPNKRIVELNEMIYANERPIVDLFAKWRQSLLNK